MSHHNNPLSPPPSFWLLDGKLALASNWVAMTRLQLLIIFVAAGTTLSGCVSTGPTQSAVSADEAEKITEEITQLTEQWSQVFANKDFDHLKRIWADDFSYTMPGGIVSDKKTGLANVSG